MLPRVHRIDHRYVVLDAALTVFFSFFFLSWLLYQTMPSFAIVSDSSSAVIMFC